MYEVEYNPGTPDIGPEFVSIRVLGDDYQPTGPNLVETFGALITLNPEGTEGETVLSHMSSELECLNQ